MTREQKIKRLIEEYHNISNCISYVDCATETELDSMFTQLSSINSRLKRIKGG